MLSGPEPQRTFLEEIVVPQAVSMKLKTAVVQGRPGEDHEAASAEVSRSRSALNPLPFSPLGGEMSAKRPEELHSVPPLAGGEIDRFNHLDAAGLSTLLSKSRHVVSRAGYSSIMDYHALGKDAILVPTPGQPEQEYLAGQFHRQRQFYSAEQNKFNRDVAVKEAGKFRVQASQAESGNLTAHLENWLQRISSY